MCRPLVIWLVHSTWTTLSVAFYNDPRREVAVGHVLDEVPSQDAVTLDHITGIRSVPLPLNRQFGCSGARAGVKYAGTAGAWIWSRPGGFDRRRHSFGVDARASPAIPATEEVVAPSGAHVSVSLHPVGARQHRLATDDAGLSALGSAIWMFQCLIHDAEVGVLICHEILSLRR